MDVADLPLADEFVAHFHDRGVEALYPTQEAAVEAGVCDGERVVAAIPTASGKTFVAQLAMLTADGPALYVVPLRALATEKYDEFDALPGVSVGMATSDFDGTDEDLAEHDVVVATSEKVDSAIRNGASWVEALACVVVDEIHLLDEDGRGPTLEVTIAKLRRLAPDVQLVGLSATVGNAGAIADWLDATLVESDWRPVELKTGVYADDAMRFSDGEVRRVAADEDGAARALARDVVDDADGQCLVFVNSRRGAQDLASALTDEFFATPASVAEELQDVALTETGTELARCVAHGVAFHHAGLASEQRRVVERAFRDRDLRVIVATPTLAAGVNVPARRVVVRDHERWNGSEMESLSVLEVHQMFGRAGRPHLDPYGEAVVVAESHEADAVRERYVEAEPEPVRSKLRSQRALRTHVLATVASGFADSRAEVLGLLDETFYAHQRRAGNVEETGATNDEAVDVTGGETDATNDEAVDGTGGETDATNDEAIDVTGNETDAAGDDGGIDAVVDEVLTYLDAVGMLAREDGGVRATPLGDLVSRVYVDPVTGASVVERLERAAGMGRVTALTVLELVCDTRDMPTVYVRDDEAGQVSSAAMDRRAELARDVMDFDGDYQAWLDALKTALLLEDVAEDAGVEAVARDYGVEPGDVRRSVERAEWLLTATESLTEHVDADLSGVAAVIRETRDALVAAEV